MHKIYFNNKPLFITGKITKDLEEYIHHKETVFIDEFNAHTVKTMLYEMELPEIQTGVFLHNDEDAVLKAIEKKLVLIKAAGGLVHTTENNLLLIFRRGKWDLPKGKLDEGEDIETCAIREINEETGLKNIQIEQPLCLSYHTYYQDGKHILKETHWFLIKTNQQMDLVPQAEEDIEKCEWVSIDQLSTYMDNTHASIHDVIHAGIKILSKTKKD